jgi:hypothetical protein
MQVDHLYCLALLRRSSRKTPIHPESAMALMNSWGKHLIELEPIILGGKEKLKFFVTRANAFLGDSRIGVRLIRPVYAPITCLLPLSKLPFCPVAGKELITQGEV